MNQDTPVYQAILRRRSIREFSGQPVDPADLDRIVTAGTWAPSGLNNQPWRFVLVTDPEIRARLAPLTHYSHIIEGAAALIAVYLDIEAIYDVVKDQQAAGACIQNMLLCAEELGLGAVWLGQILKNKKQVNAVFGLDERYDLMAVLALGHPRHRDQQSTRKPLTEVILKRFQGEN